MQKGRPCLSVAVVVFFGLFGWLVGSSAYVRFCFSLFFMKQRFADVRSCGTDGIINRLLYLICYCHFSCSFYCYGPTVGGV